ncbi:unnamed protein product (macronuclear) [Paramecium tetraurelia]|uniref:HTH psq-type domain-containing protein n=1 Tax=Paramecium tetraurelia TaxID=5888 RepID=A0DC52_PARTE|nr:uncharacterized protein GSPATT00015496001 [Paramecium tetraurelia]CAK80619.1 unnamed protein product [Paramecium tetraurelia]|eukprot:XP_001448016.1 hypothetical protein (macronuclear) [Paramecium tetraurelia strain d4-2]
MDQTGLKTIILGASACRKMKNEKSSQIQIDNFLLLNLELKNGMNSGNIAKKYGIHFVQTFSYNQYSLLTLIVTVRYTPFIDKIDCKDLTKALRVDAEKSILI